jgi:hypothetical protein
MGIFLQIKKFAILHKWWLLLITFLTIIGLYIAAMFILIIIVLVYWYTQKIKKERSNMSKLSDLTKDISTLGLETKIDIENMKFKNYNDIIDIMNYWTLQYLPTMDSFKGCENSELYKLSKFFVENKENISEIEKKINGVLLKYNDTRSLINLAIKYTNTKERVDDISFLLLFLLIFRILGRDYGIRNRQKGIYKNFYGFYRTIVGNPHIFGGIFLKSHNHDLYNRFMKLHNINTSSYVQAIISTGNPEDAMRAQNIIPTSLFHIKDLKKFENSSTDINIYSSINAGQRTLFRMNKRFEEIVKFIINERIKD